MDINPLDIIAKGAKLNPLVTKILIAVPVLLACVALGTKLVTDPITGIIGGILTILAAVVLVVVASTSTHLLGGVGVWFARFCLGAFCAATTVLFTSWGWDWPKPTGCLLHPDKQCVTEYTNVTDDDEPEIDPTYAVLRRYLFPDNKSGAVDQARVAQVRAILAEKGMPNAAIGPILVSADQANLRKEIIQRLGLEK